METEGKLTETATQSRLLPGNSVFGIQALNPSGKKEINFYSIFPTPLLVSGFHLFLVKQLLWLNIAAFAFKHFGNPFKVILAIKKVKKTRRQIIGDHKVIKAAKVDGRYYWNMNTPGFPSSTFNKFAMAGLKREFTDTTKHTYLTSIIFAITKKCPLRCEHCFEWNELNNNETLSLDDLKKIVEKFQERGIAQIQLSGGEPLTRLDDIIELIKSAKSGTDFWILTSGYKLTLENAIKLKNAGLNGIAISLDHFDPDMHNAFRGFKTSYEWVEKAAHNARSAKLVVSLSLCATKSFINEENMMRYAHLAKKLRVVFIRVLEPRAVGHYAGKEVELTQQQEKILEDFYLKMNFDPAYKNMPIVTYHGYYHRRAGCFGAGNRYLYVDTDGHIHACPFCRNKSGNVLSSPLAESIDAIRSVGCHKYEDAMI